MPFCYQTLRGIQFSSPSQSWPCQKPESGNEELKGLEEESTRGWELPTETAAIQEGADAADASFRPDLLLLKESLPEGTREFAKFT